jgi:hypothetical protein
MERTMNRLATRLPLLVTLLSALVLLLHGPIMQPPRYHDFADSRMAFGLHNAADVFSNAGFALVGLWGLLRLWPQQRHPALAASWPGYRLFLWALILTAAGSSFYHLAPDNARLVWDRLPIALACAGLLAAVHAETASQENRPYALPLLALTAILSVAWWHFGEVNGGGDLRPYLLLQGLPLLLIPLWQWIYRAPHADRHAFGLAIILYVAAKAAELLDHETLAALGWMSGHTIKHLLATSAAAVIVRRLICRTHAVAASCSDGDKTRLAVF